MHYLLNIYSDEKQWDGMSQSQREQGFAAYMAYRKALEEAGVFAGSNRLESTAAASTVRVDANGKTTVLDGPYIDTKEQLGGYFIVDVADLDAAIAWAARCPGASHGTVEVRPIAAM